MRAQTGGFDKISLQGIAVTGSLETLFPRRSFFSSELRSGSSRGELYACHREGGKFFFCLWTIKKDRKQALDWSTDRKCVNT